MTKYDQMVKHLKRYGSITKLKAGDSYRIFGLAEQVRRFEERGAIIDRIYVPQRNGQPFRKYIFKGMRA